MITTFDYLSIHPAISTAVESFLSLDKWLQKFTTLFLFRYVRLVVNMISFLTYKATRILPFPRIPILLPKDVIVIVPTVEPLGNDFDNCIYSIANNNPAKIMIVTDGPGKEVQDSEIDRFCDSSSSLLEFFHCEVPNKRAQVCKALQKV